MVGDRSIDAILAACEQDLAAGGAPDLRATGFWRAVTQVKKHPELAQPFAARIARIDRATFRRRVRLVFPVDLGIALVLGGLLIDMLFLALALGAGHPWREVLVLLGAAGLDIAVHGLAHLVVGTLVGIEFTDWFLDLPKRPQPGFKIDYGSYLRASARSRAWMHAAGAIATKLVPFLVIPYALAIGTDSWAIWVLAAVGVLQILTDVLFSVRASDWKKFRREMRFART